MKRRYLTEAEAAGADGCGKDYLSIGMGRGRKLPNDVTVHKVRGR